MKKKIYIVGAHSRAQTLAVYLQYLYEDMEVAAYLYENGEENPEKSREQDADTYQDAQKFFEGNLYSPCNMFIMKKEILDELCSWLFPLLYKVQAYSGQKEDGYQNRYPGFMAERLMTFYFGRKKSNYKVAYADKNFLN